MAKKVGELAFLGGAAIAILAALLPLEGYLGNVRLLLVVLGLAVGLLNVTGRESTDFLIAAVALLTANAAGETLKMIPWVGAFLQNAVGNLGVFVVPAAVIVALKAVYELAKD